MCDINLVLFGSSGGGYAALNSSQYYNKCTTLVINPQVYISKYFYSEYFSNIVKIHLNKPDIYSRNNIIPMLLNNKNIYIYISNLNDKNDFEDHLKPLLYSINIQKISIGLNIKENFFFFFYNSLGGHNAQGDQFIFWHYINLIELIKLKKYKENEAFYKNLSCFICKNEFLKYKNSLYEKGVS